MFLCVYSYVFTVYDCSNCTHVGPCKGFRKRSYEPGSPCSVFSCFFPTVFLHFTEQIKWWWWWWWWIPSVLVVICGCEHWHTQIGANASLSWRPPPPRSQRCAGSRADGSRPRRTHGLLQQQICGGSRLTATMKHLRNCLKYFLWQQANKTYAGWKIKKDTLSRFDI